MLSEAIYNAQTTIPSKSHTNISRILKKITMNGFQTEDASIDFIEEVHLGRRWILWHEAKVTYNSKTRGWSVSQFYFAKYFRLT